MVGNPNYGNWQTNSNGISFWQWYGMYRILGDVFDRVEYGSWSKRRKYSYYNDYGRSRYSSPKQIKTQSALETRTRQTYQRQGKQFTSPYASKKTGASGLSRSSYTPPKSRSSYSIKFIHIILTPTLFFYLPRLTPREVLLPLSRTDPELLL